MRVADMVHSSKIYGPGKRTVVWLQGCSIRCDNCWNDELWSFKGGRFMMNHEIIQHVETHCDEGITLLGGEPLDQPKRVLQFIEHAQSLGINVLLYTGYELHELSKIQRQCVELADIVIHGRYMHELRSLNLLWRGSTNQEILINNEKFRDIDLTEKRQMEVHIDSMGQTKVVGYPTEELVESVSLLNGKMKSFKLDGDRVEV
ncbi:MAG TPA: radical SAM protein [Candidatus Poseidoniales archaeon]|nr:MAG TPA: radical SAM protein [Candidatus Poseidoniales archaeon]HII62860.1 radical SAM protein [Candidatus Poseidoniaceae archaeon]